MGVTIYGGGALSRLCALIITRMGERVRLEVPGDDIGSHVSAQPEDGEKTYLLSPPLNALHFRGKSNDLARARTKTLYAALKIVREVTTFVEMSHLTLTRDARLCKYLREEYDARRRADMNCAWVDGLTTALFPELNMRGGIISRGEWLLPTSRIPFVNECFDDCCSVAIYLNGPRRREFSIRTHIHFRGYSCNNGDISNMILSDGAGFSMVISDENICGELELSRSSLTAKMQPRSAVNARLSAAFPALKVRVTHTQVIDRAISPDGMPRIVRLNGSAFAVAPGYAHAVHSAPIAAMCAVHMLRQGKMPDWAQYFMRGAR